MTDEEMTQLAINTIRTLSIEEILAARVISLEISRAFVVDKYAIRQIHRHRQHQRNAAQGGRQINPNNQR